MAVPKKRTSIHKRKLRRGPHNKKLQASLRSVSSCQNCNENVFSYHVCGNCGYYGKKQIINFDKKINSKSKEVAN